MLLLLDRLSAFNTDMTDKCSERYSSPLSRRGLPDAAGGRLRVFILVVVL